MNARQRMASLGVVATTLVITVGSVAVVTLYRVALREAGEALAHALESQARLVEAIFEGEVANAGGDTTVALDATLRQVQVAQHRFRGYGATGESVVVQMVGQRLTFHVGPAADTALVPEPVALPSVLALPMQRAVAGEAGVMVGPDYDGVTVVAAYTPVRGTPLGMVAKKDLAEVRAPFVRAAGLTAAVGLVLVVVALGVGALLGSPLLAVVEERESAHEAILEHFPGVAFRAVIDAGGVSRYDVFEGASEDLTGWPASHFLDDPGAWERLVGEHGMEPLRRCGAPHGAEPTISCAAEYQVRLRDGADRWVRTSARRAAVAEGDAVWVVGVHHDVTEIAAKEEVVRKAERALRVRDAVDDVLASVVSEGDMWGPLCSGLVGEGAYRMAWIGVPLDTPGRPVRPVATAGPEAGCLDDFRASWSADDPIGGGPTGTAVRTRTLQVSHDIEVDERMDPWREVAGRHGLRSTAAVPVLSDGVVVAVLNLYAPERGGFDDREVDLLQGVAAAIGRQVDLVRAQEGWAAVEGRFQAFMAASPAVAWLKDAEGRHLWVNPAWEDVFGLRRDDWWRKTEYDLFEAGVADAVRKQDREVLETGQAVSALEGTGGLGGAQRVWRVVKFPLARPGGEVWVGGVAVDITGEVQAEEALRRSEERLRLALRAGGHGLYDLDLRTGLAEVNDDYSIMLGYDPATFTETNAAWRDRLHPDDRAAVYGEYEACVAGQRDMYRVEFRQRTADGGWKWTLSLGEIVEWDEAGAPVRMTGTHTDIQALKDVEAALRESEDRFRRAVESSPEAILIQTGGRFAYVNKAALALLGADTEEEVLGRPILDRLEPSERKDVARLIRLLGEGRLAVANEGLSVSRMDGTRIAVEASGVSFRYQGEDGTLVFARDITDRLQAEGRIRTQLDELRRWQAVMLAREDRVQELKREVNEVCRRAGIEPRYPSQTPDLP